MTGDTELQAKIAALAGRINRHKSHQPPPSSTTLQPPQHYAGIRAPRWPQHPPGRPVKHRNKTLIIKAPEDASKQDSGAADQTSASSLVRKRGVNNQLMTKSTFEREQNARMHHQQVPAMSGQQIRSYEERRKLAKHFQRSTVSRLLEIDGTRFEMKEDGSKLVRVQGADVTGETPRKAVIAGVVFLRTKNGNLLREGALKDGVSSEKQKPQCDNFTKNGIMSDLEQLLPDAVLLPRLEVLTYHLGACPFGPRCRFAHDPTKVAICKTFLRTGQCPSGKYCDLSHEPTYHRVSACNHFQKDRCSNDKCRYPHIHVSPGAPVCRPFATLGYCDAGPKCDKRHVFECPDFANTGSCPKHDTCPLPHILRASTERANIRNIPDSASEIDEGSADERDLHSDDLAEDLVMAGSGETGLSLANNDDFVPFD